MKKENRKMAQQRRAEERRKKALKHKISKILAIATPILFIAILVTLLIIFSDRDSVSDSGSEAESEISNTSENSSNDSSSYSDDPDLTVENGDTVNIDYVGSVDGEEFSGGSTNGTGTDLVIGSGSYIDNFEEQLIGSHPGDTIEIYVTFPDPYSNNTDLSGKEALFKVTINGIYK